MDNKKRASKILSILSGEFPDAKTALNYSTTLELVVATMLSAQCTDARVNATTPALFRRFKGPRGYAEAAIPEIEEKISSINFYHNKARNLKGIGEVLLSDFGGEVPSTMDELVTLPGVGRKTANIILAEAFGQAALAVDTHVKRVAARLGLTGETDPDKVEADLRAIIPKRRWRLASHCLILHGRKTCKARRPLCEGCCASKLCNYYNGGSAGVVKGAKTGKVGAGKKGA